MCSLSILKQEILHNVHKTTERNIARDSLIYNVTINGWEFLKVIKTCVPMLFFVQL